MYILKFAVGVIATIVGMVIAANLLALVLGLIGIVLKVVWMVVILCLLCLVGYAIYRIVTPGAAEGV